MTFPLKKDEIKFVQSLNPGADNTITFSYSEYQQFYDIITEMIRRQVLIDKTSAVDLGCYKYFVVSDINAFCKYILSENQKAKGISIREWSIGIVAALIGALVSILVKKGGF